MQDCKRRGDVREAQLSAAGLAIGCVGCVVLTASSVYTALKLGALPWPTIFTSVVSLVLLRALGRRSLNEANVTQVIMSAGSMVAGGLAFTIPGAWMLGLGNELGFWQMLFVALAGALLGLVCTALIRRRFVDESGLEYPVGVAAAETLRASREGGATGVRLFGSMGAAGLWCVARDVLGLIPSMLLALPIPGVSFGIYNSPMMLSLGFLVGGGAIAFWLLGGLVANFGIVVGGVAAGLVDIEGAQGIVSSLGMGLMMGSGVGVVAKDILPRLADILLGGSRAGTKGGRADAPPAADAARARGGRAGSGSGRTAFGIVGDIKCGRDAGVLALLVAAAALLLCCCLGLGSVVAAVVVLLSFVTTIMSAQSVGQTGIDPMEIFGLIVLLLVAAISDTSEARLFLVAGVVAVACGLAGDVMSDFKTGALIGTNPRALWAGQAVGALLGCVVAALTLHALFAAYGAEAFGTGQLFVSAQASVVATMVSGIPSTGAFALGLLGGIALHVAGLPSMMFGLGIYLPFYMTLTGALGAGLKLVVDRLRRARGAAESAIQEDDIIVASGMLGGESIVGVICALASVMAGLLG